MDKQAYFDKVEYEPHSGQKLFHQSDARFRVYLAGRRTGKSVCSARELVPHLFQPNRRYWIVGPQYSLAEKEFRVIWDDLIVKLQLGKDKRVKKAFNLPTGNMYIEFPWGSRVQAMSAQHPESLVGEALDGVIMAEAAKQSRTTWERFIRPALADKKGWAIFSTTPEGYNWIYDMWALGQNPDPKFDDYWSMQAPSWSNDIVYPGGRNDSEILLLERTTTPEFFMQEIGADFASFVGKIFPEWSESLHVRSHTFNPAWPNYMTCDFGYNNPAAFIEFQVSPWDEVFIWREHYQANTTMEKHLEILKTREQPYGYHLDLAFGDSADPEAAEYISQHLINCYAVYEAKENWRQGIDLMRTFMRPHREQYDEDGEQLFEDENQTVPVLKPSLYVDHSCSNTIREFNNYRAKEPVKGRNVPEKSNDTDDHAIDALRYGFVSLFELGAKHHLGEVYKAIPDDTASGRTNRHVLAVSQDSRGSVLAGAGKGIFSQNDTF